MRSVSYTHLDVYKRQPHECRKRAGTADAVAAAAVRGDILMQRAAEKDVDHLDAAADAEDGLAAAVKVLEECPLLLVTHRILSLIHI